MSTPAHSRIYTFLKGPHPYAAVHYHISHYEWYCGARQFPSNSKEDRQTWTESTKIPKIHGVVHAPMDCCRECTSLSPNEAFSNPVEAFRNGLAHGFAIGPCALEASRRDKLSGKRRLDPN